MRLKIIRLIFIIFLAAIVVDLAYIQGIKGEYFFDLSANNRIRSVALEGWRGRIWDKNGELLVDNVMSLDVAVVPQDINDFHGLFEFLSGVLNVPANELIGEYQKARISNFAPVVVAEDIPRAKAIIIEENKYRFPCLSVQQDFKRKYLLGEDAAHVIGYVGKINRARREKMKEYGYTSQSVVGYGGVEEYYDLYLKGGEGGEQIEVNSRGQQVRLLSIKKPTRGEDIHLTLDRRLQRMIHQALAGRKGAVIIMDADSGEVMGLNSSPSFDPNVFFDRDNSARISALFRDRDSPILNRVIAGLYPPGSVFKIPVAVGALQNHKINQSTTFTCDGVYELGGSQFRCTHVHGPQDLIEAIAHSCNIYFYHVGLILGADLMHDYARLLGLGAPTHIDLPYERAGNIPSRRSRLLSSTKKWFTGETLNYAIGQGQILVTPLQLAGMMAVIARDGMEVQPYVIKTIGEHEIVPLARQRSVKIDKDVLRIVQQGMRSTVTDPDGTAHVLDLPDLYVAGKTGTAQTSGDQETHAWFAGYAKSENRKIAFCFFLEHGGSSHNACELARQVFLQMQTEKMF